MHTSHTKKKKNVSAKELSYARIMKRKILFHYMKKTRLQPYIAKDN